MQLERFDQFVNEIRGDSNSTKGTVALEIYRFFGGKWYDSLNNILSDVELTKDLGLTRRKKSDWRKKADLWSYFLVKELDCVITVKFSKPAKKQTRQRYADHFERCLRNSKNAFDATHDTLTGLLNRGGFEVKLSSLSKHELKDEVVPKEATSSALQSASVIGLLALDIDHFKQVNDSFGHQYGDMVLKCFSRRLKKKAEEVMTSSSKQIRVTVARLGGEEFSAFIEGVHSHDQLLEIAEQFRLAISEQALPSDTELKEMSADYGGVLPLVTDRRVTASIGVASTSLPLMDSLDGVALNKLVHQADTALYRAKVGGRNLVRDFGEIIDKYGRVLEHHQDTAIVTIDIGSLVGVSIGQEFLVYHPDFSGGIPFMFRDGRTQKRLGNYPRVPSGRIVAFNVQPEISFCKVVQNDCPGNFSGGALLEQIPIGSLSHLLAFETQLPAAAAPDVVSADKLPEAVGAIIKNKAKPFVVVFCIKDFPEVSVKRGQVFINQCIMMLYREIREKFGFLVSLGQIQASSLAVVLSEGVSSDSSLAKANLIISSLNEKLAGQTKFVAGIFDPNLDDKSGSKYDLSVALDFARFSVRAEDRKPDGLVQKFDGMVASDTVYESRRRKLYTAALTDHLWFVEHGVQNAYLENQAALCEIEKPERDPEAALLVINRAIALNNKVANFFANKAYIEHFRGDLKSTLQNYRVCWDVDKNYVLTEVYRYSYVLSLVHSINEGSLSEEGVRNSVVEIDKVIGSKLKEKDHNRLSELKEMRQSIVTDSRFAHIFLI